MKTQLGLPFTGARALGLPAESHLLACPNCTFENAIEAWDGMGACDGNVICPKCAEEVSVETGEPAVPCRDCEFCNTG